DETAATAALRASKAAFARVLGTLPGAAVQDGPDAGWVDSGVPDAAFNSAWSSAASLDTAVDRAVAHFRDRSRPFHWDIGLRGEPDDAGELLVKRGLTVEDREPGMWLDLGSYRDAAAPSGAGGLVIRPVGEPGRLREWMDVWGCGAPPAAIESWYRVYSALPYRPEGARARVVGCPDGAPVACASAWLTGHIAAISYVVTRPESRRRGIGEAMTRAACRAARAAGGRIAVLTASDMGAG